jgi:hypothetical protein
MFCEHCGSGPKCIVCGRNDLRQAVPTARFWEYVTGGWVKISLRPNHARHWARGRDTEEGWSLEGMRWVHGGDGVPRDWWEEGSDCDGRYSKGGTQVCPLADLAAREPYRHNEYDWTPPGLPEWENADQWQRDYAAEAAGY